MSEPTRSIDWAVSGLAQLFDTVLTAAAASVDLTEANREQFEEAAAAAFASGMSLSGLIETYLGGAGEVWEHVFTNADSSRAVELGRALRRVSEQAVSSLASGFESAQRLSIRAEESLRRAFLDDLLSADPDPGRLAEAARQLDFPAFDHAVVAVASGQRSFTDAGPVHRRVQTELESRAPRRHLRVTAHDGRIVIIGLDTPPSALRTLLSRTFATLPEIEWQIGIGSVQEGLERIGTSFRQSLEALRIGSIFGLESPALFDEVLPQRLLLADPEIIETLYRTVIEPLDGKPRSELLRTLESFIEHGGNMAEVARHLDIGARTVAYRLDRIREVTGLSPRESADRFVLELAYRGMPLVAQQRRRV